MKNRRQKLILSLLMWSLAGLYGCKTASSEQRSPAVDVAAETASARKTLDSFFHAVDVKDWKTVDEIIASDFEFYGDDLTILSRTEFINAMREDDMKIQKFDLKDVKVSLSPDGQMAWVKYRAHMESTMRSAPYNMQSAETVALRKENGHWKLTHNHASVRKLNDNAAARPEPAAPQGR